MYTSVTLRSIHLFAKCSPTACQPNHLPLISVQLRSHSFSSISGSTYHSTADLRPYSASKVCHKLDNFDGENDALPPELKPDLMPKHVALILDGTRRWCRSKGKELDYELFFQRITRITELCAKWDIKTVSNLIFTTENMGRSQEYFDLYFGYFKRYIESNMEHFKRHGIRVSSIGKISVLPQWVQDFLFKVEEETKDCSKVHLILAVHYGARAEIVNVTRSIGEKIKAGVLDPQDIDESKIEQELWTTNTTSGQVVSYPDFLIRTGGELRLTNYLLWQLAYTELYFTDVHGPDFEEAEFVKALQSFQGRNRRYGK